MPAAVLINTFLRAATASAMASPTLHDLSLRLALTATPAREIQVLLDGTAVRLASRTPSDAAGQDAPWLTHVTATVRPGDTTAGVPLTLADPAGLPVIPVDPGIIRDRLTAGASPQWRSAGL